MTVKLSDQVCFRTERFRQMERRLGIIRTKSLESKNGYLTLKRIEMYESFIKLLKLMNLSTFRVSMSLDMKIYVCRYINIQGKFS